MRTVRRRLFLWIYLAYGAAVTTATLFLTYGKGLERLTSPEASVLVPGAVLFALLVPGGIHSNARLEPTLATLNVLAYLAIPLIIHLIVRTWRRANQPWRPQE